MATGITALYNLPYPLITDPVDVHGDIQDLANSVASVLNTQLATKIAKSDISAKGVILVGTGSAAYTAQTVGVNGRVLTANSATASGVEWATPTPGYLAPTLGSTSIASGATVTTIAGLTLTSATASTASSSSIPLIVSGVASQSANLQEWRNSSGTVLLSISPTGVLNASGTTNIGPVLTFANPGVGQDTRFNFTKTSDTAWLSVFERASDSTYYEFGMGDNPTGGDYFQWKFDNYEGPALGWMPLQIGVMTTRFTSAVSNWGSYSIPVNTPFTTLNASATSSTDFQVNKYSPTNNVAQTLNKDSGTGTGIATLNAQSFTGSSRLGYWILIDAGGTTFTWGTGYTANTPTATGVTITGAAQTLNNGVTITLSLTGHVSGDRWSFLCFPRPTVGIGGSPLLTSMETVYPAAAVVGVTVRGAASQTADLQQWQNSAGTVLAEINASGSLELNGKDIELMTLMGAF
jgi:hypothetical protein